MQKDIRRRKCNTFYMTRKDQSKDSIWEKRERKEKKKNPQRKWRESGEERKKNRCDPKVEDHVPLCVVKTTRVPSVLVKGSANRLSFLTTQ